MAIMFRCTFLILCLALGNDILCTANTTDLVTTLPTAAPTTAAPVPTTPAPVPTTPAAQTTTTLAPQTTTTLAPQTTTTPAAPTTTTPAAPTTTTPAAPTTTKPTPAVPTTTIPTPAAPTTTTPAAPNTTATAAPNTTTPAAPTTTASPNTTTPASPNTTATVPTTTPVPPMLPPTVGNYSIKTDVNSTACLMADFGLRIGYKLGAKVEDINLDPNVTKFSGVCDVNSSSLLLTSDSITILFNFSSEAKKFHLHALNVTVTTPGAAVFTAANANLTLWAAAVGSSYMCNKEQTYNITNTLTLHTFGLRVQPFEVTKGEFSTAHECSLDDTSILIPIIVGAALAGLILIVVIAYVIGRRKTYVGYQTL